MKLISFNGTVVATLLVFLPGCADGVHPVMAESPPPVVEELPPPVVPELPPGQIFPTLSRPGGIFADPGDIYGFDSYHGGHLRSRYVLYEDGTFGLQFSSPRWGFFEYPGRYSTTGSDITFRFQGSNTAGAWLARATVDGRAITVEYNVVMWLADFRGGVYVRSEE